MATAEEHLRLDMGALITNLLFANAMLKSENDKLKATVTRLQTEVDSKEEEAAR